MDSVSNVRSELVARLKRQVQDKTYKVKSEEIADKIAQKLREDEAAVTLLKKNRWTA